MGDRIPASCATTPAERVTRGVIALFTGAFAISMFHQLWVAIPAGIFTVFLVVGVITGWCPTQLLPQRRSERPTGNDLGYAEMPGAVRIEATTRRRSAR